MCWGVWTHTLFEAVRTACPVPRTLELPYHEVVACGQGLFAERPMSNECVRGWSQWNWAAIQARSTYPGSGSSVVAILLLPIFFCPPKHPNELHFLVFLSIFALPTSNAITNLHCTLAFSRWSSRFGVCFRGGDEQRDSGGIWLSIMQCYII